MIKFDLKKLAVGAALGFFTVTGGTLIANAQSDRTIRQQQRIQKQEQKLERQRAKLAAQQQSEWTRRNGQIRVYNRTGTGYYTLDNNGSIASGRYRVNRNGRYYNTDQRGAELLRNAVNEGYRQGFMAGRSNLSSNRRGSWSSSNVYRSGNMGYQNNVDRGQYQYYFQQGFQRGYQDGSNRQYMNDRSDRFQYGTYDNGQPSILSNILNQVLNLQNY
jgi:hypothetical protein